MTRQAWYIFEDGKTHGPVTARELLYLVEMERLHPDALVWRPGFSEWKPAHEVEGIYKPPPLPLASDSAAGRAPRVAHSPDFVRVISPPLRTPDDGLRGETISGRATERSHGPNNGLSDLGPIEIEGSAESEPSMPGGAPTGARGVPHLLDHAIDEEPGPAPTAATLGAPGAAIPDDDVSYDDEPYAPGAAGPGPFPSPAPDEDIAGDADAEFPQERPNGLAESVAALDQPARHLMPPGTDPALQEPEPLDADPLEEPTGERLEVLDRLVNRMEALETNLRDEIAKNQVLERQISHLQSGDDAAPDMADASLDPVQLPGVPDPAALQPSSDQVSEQAVRAKSEQEADRPLANVQPLPDRPQPKPSETLARQANATGLPEVDVDIDGMDTDFGLDVELDENFDAGLPSGEGGSADWLNVAAESDSSGKSYLSRHWSGELGLGRTVWANALPLFLLLLALPYGLSFIDFGPGPTKLLVTIGLLVVSVPALVWMAVGVWRAAENHRAWRGGFVWPSLAQTWALLSLIVFAGTFTTSLMPEQVSQLFSLRLDLDSVNGDAGSVADKAPGSPTGQLATSRSFDPESRGLGDGRVSGRTLADDAPGGAQLAASGADDLKSLRARISELRDNTQKSLVQVISFNANKIPTSVGMGFYVSEDLVATTYHTVQGAHALSLQNVGEKDITFSARIKSYSADLDVALIETTRKSKALNMTAESEPRIGDPVVVLGNPRWEASSATTGSIRAAQATDGGVLYVSTALVSPGSSGGPVFDRNGRLMGLARFAVDGAKPVTYIMPSRLIAAVAKRDMSQVRESPSSQINDDIRRTLKLTNYVKAAGSETEIISLRNETRHSLENIFFAVLYKGKGGDILYGRSLQMRGPLRPGAEESMTVEAPDLLKSYAAKGSADSGPVMTIELIPLDYLPSDYSG